jgi:phosphate starvation-inducible PhoH-like protein
MKNKLSESIQIEFDDNNILSSLFGIADSNIQLLEKINNVKIDYRGNKVKISGKKKLSIQETRKALEKLFNDAKKGIEIDEDKVKETKSLISLNFNKNSQLDFFIQTKKRKIIPRSLNQKKYFQFLEKKNMTFAIGPAGTGKTYLAVAKAVSCLQKGIVKKIILSRPAVEAGEKLGFLPGDLKEKIDPYLRPIYDALYEMMPYDEVEKKISNGIIEIAPIAFMRGRTLEDCFIILDEAQNSTKIQMKMFLTRLGKNSKMVIVGDKTQIDLISRNESGLLDSEEKLKNISDIGFIYLKSIDVVRHELVKKIINAYIPKNDKI